MRKGPWETRVEPQLGDSQICYMLVHGAPNMLRTPFPGFIDNYSYTFLHLIDRNIHLRVVFALGSNCSYDSLQSRVTCLRGMAIETE